MSLRPLGPGLGQPLSQLSCCPAGIWLVCFTPSLHPLHIRIHGLDLSEPDLGKEKIGILPLKDFWVVTPRWEVA